MSRFLDILSFRVLWLLSNLTIIGTSERRVLVVGNFGLTSFLSEGTSFTKVTLFNKFVVVSELEPIFRRHQLRLFRERETVEMLTFPLMISDLALTLSASPEPSL